MQFKMVNDLGCNINGETLPKISFKVLPFKENQYLLFKDDDLITHTVDKVAYGASYSEQISES